MTQKALHAVQPPAASPAAHLPFTTSLLSMTIFAQREVASGGCADHCRLLHDFSHPLPPVHRPTLLCSAGRLVRWPLWTASKGLLGPRPLQEEGTSRRLEGRRRNAPEYFPQFPSTKRVTARVGWPSLPATGLLGYGNHLSCCPSSLGVTTAVHCGLPWRPSEPPPGSP